jgi:hypothetical protein
VQRHEVQQPHGLFVAFAQAALEALAFHGVDDDLQPAVIALAGELLLHRIALSEPHGHELADDLFATQKPSSRGCLETTM